jgi:hypothetical protein
MEDEGGGPEEHLDTETIGRGEKVSSPLRTTLAKGKMYVLLGTREARRERRLRHFEDEEADVESLKARKGSAGETKEKERERQRTIAQRL